jgi:RNA polymerase sigma-70 factor (ECF subfamily)
LLEEAMLRVRLRVAPQTWQAFRLTALEGLSGTKAAARIPMRVAQVFVARRRVQRMLRDEVARLGKVNDLGEAPRIRPHDMHDVPESAGHPRPTQEVPQ